MKKSIIIVSIIGIVIILIYTLIKTFQPDLEGTNEDNLTFSQNVPPEYLDLLGLDTACCKTSEDELHFLSSLKGKYRNTISRFAVYGKYYLQIYKMDSSYNRPLDSSIKLRLSDTMAYSYSTPYSGDDATDMQFWYKLTKPERPRSIFFRINGDSTKQLSLNDSIAYYYSKCRTFSIKLNLVHKSDIYGLCSDKIFRGVPIEFLFLRKRHELFLFILSSEYAYTMLNQDLLYNLVFTHGRNKTSMLSPPSKRECRAKAKNAGFSCSGQIARRAALIGNFNKLRNL